MTRLRPSLVPPVAALMFVLALAPAGAQDRLSAMPGYDQFSKMQPPRLPARGSAGRWPHVGRRRPKLHLHHRGQVVSIRPRDDEGHRDGRRAAPRSRPRAVGEAPRAAAAARPDRLPGKRAPPPPVVGRGGRTAAGSRPRCRRAPWRAARHGAAARGRQVDCVVSPDGKLKAFYRDRNLWVAQRRRHEREARSRPTAARRRASSTARAAGSTAKSSARRRRSGGRPTARKVGFYRFDESQVKDFYLQMNQTADAGRRSTSRRIRRPARRIRSPTSSSTTSPTEQDDDARRARRQAVRQRRRRPLRLQRALVARRHRAARSTARTAGSTSWSSSRAARRRRKCRVDRPRGVADGLGRQPPADALPGRQQALHLGVGAQRLHELLPLRPDAASCINPITTQHDVRVRRDREGRRGRRA